MRKFLTHLLAYTALTIPATAQVTVSGPVTGGHPPVWVRSISPNSAVVKDGGGSLAGQITELGISGPGTPFCINDVPPNPAGGPPTGPYRQTCLGDDANGGFLSYNPYGGATALPFSLRINNTTYPVPGSVTGLPSVATNSALAAFSTTQSAVVYRAGYYNPGDGGAGYYTLSSSPCSLNSGAGDNGSQVHASNGNCWLLTSPQACYSVSQFGAVGDGVVGSTSGTDNQSFIQAAINAAQTAGICVSFPGKTYKTSVTSITSNNLSITCLTGADGTGGTKLVAATITGIVFDVGNVSGYAQNGCNFFSTSKQTGNSYVHFNGSNKSFISHSFMQNGWNPVQQDGNGTGFFFDAMYIYDWANDGFQINGGGDQYWNEIVMDQTNVTNTPHSCINATQNGGFSISNSEFIHCHYGVLGSVTAGHNDFWPYITNTRFDTCDFIEDSGAHLRGGIGIFFTATGGGVIKGFDFSQIWTSTCTNGIKMTTDGVSTISAGNITNWQGINNFQQAGVFDWTQFISIVNPMLTGNSQQQGGLYSDIYLGNHSNGMSITGGNIRPLQGYAATTHYAVEMQAGSTGFLNIMNTNMIGHQDTMAVPTNPVFTAGSTPSFGSGVYNSPGYNPAGPAVPSDVIYGTSPAWSGPCGTLTCIHSSSLAQEFVHFEGGTCSSITVANGGGGTPITFSGTSNVTVPLSPIQTLASICSSPPTISIVRN